MESYKNCSSPGTPNWISLVLNILKKDPNTLERLPGSAKALYHLGVDSLPALGGKTLACCGEKYVNQEGLYTESTYNPILEVPTTLTSIDTSFLAKTPILFTELSLQCKNSNMIVNPLSWPLITPIITSQLECRTCLNIGDSSILPPGLGSLQGYKIIGSHPSIRKEHKELEVKLGEAYKLHLKGELYSSRSLGLNILENEDLVIAESSGSIAVKSKNKKGMLTIITNFYETPISILYPYRFHQVIVTEDTLVSNAISLGFSNMKLAIGSKHPITLSVRPGRIEIEFYKTLRISSGGELVALRASIEDAVIYQPIEYCEDGLAHMRATNSVAIMHNISVDNKTLSITAYSPVTDGILELRIRAPVSHATIYDCRIQESILFRKELGRIPLPWGSWYEVSVKLKKALFGLSRKKL